MAAGAGRRVNNLQQRIEAVESALQRRQGADEPLHSAARPTPGFDHELSKFAHEVLKRMFSDPPRSCDEVLAELRSELGDAV